MGDRAPEEELRFIPLHSYKRLFGKKILVSLGHKEHTFRGVKGVLVPADKNIVTEKGRTVNEGNLDEA